MSAMTTLCASSQASENHSRCVYMRVCACAHVSVYMIYPLDVVTANNSKGEGKRRKRRK